MKDEATFIKVMSKINRLQEKQIEEAKKRLMRQELKL